VVKNQLTRHKSTSKGTDSLFRHAKKQSQKAYPSMASLDD